jgi:hypothetical protein
MRELHGLTYLSRSIDLKHQLLLFDRLHLYANERVFAGTLSLKRHPDMAPVMADVRFLHSIGLVRPVTRAFRDEFINVFRDIDKGRLPLDSVKFSSDLALRRLASKMDKSKWDVVPVCSLPLPKQLPNLGESVMADGLSIESTLRIGLHALPLPDETTSLDDVLPFKSELRDKHWDLRRFLRTLAAKPLGESEIRDEIEYHVNEYQKAMKLHHIKASQSFVDVFILSPLEIVENLVKFNWSKIAKGALSIRKRKIELMEAEMKAPGRECAYVFDAWKKFGLSDK